MWPQVILSSVDLLDEDQAWQSRHTQNHKGSLKGFVVYEEPSATEDAFWKWFFKEQCCEGFLRDLYRFFEELFKDMRFFKEPWF